MLFVVDTDRGGAGLNNRTAYVGPTRGREDIRVYTNDNERMVPDLSRDVSHASAIEQATAEASTGASGRTRMKGRGASASARGRSGAHEIFPELDTRCHRGG